MAERVRYPAHASVYEAIRTHPGAMERLNRIGVTREYLDYRLDEAARALEIPIEWLSEAVEGDREPVALA